MSTQKRRSEAVAGDDANENDEPLLCVRGLKTHFPLNTGFISSLTFDRSRRIPLTIDDTSVRAVDDVSFDLHRGETLGVVGESGCGKSTLARTLLGLDIPTEGTITFDGTDVTSFDSDERRLVRRNAQIVFQDPQSSLNPRREVGTIIADPLEAAGWDATDRQRRALELLDDVGLKREHYSRYPHELSGGQRQRINIARALSIHPDLVIADEPVSGLDMSVQAQILSLLDELQNRYGLTYLFITHDLSVIRYVADRVAVMYLGQFIEVAPTRRLFAAPHHPYTRALLDAVPNPNPDARPVEAQIAGDVPSPSDPPSGCRFHTRCPELIPPDGFTRAAYREFAAFRSAIERGTAALDGDALDTYFDEPLPPRAAAAVRSAAEHARNGDRDAAYEPLSAFVSVCEATVPPLEDAGAPNHQSACHLTNEDREPYTW